MLMRNNANDIIKIGRIRIPGI
ncbi:unnamed protein product [Debaryomyces fabryi]|nr:unnamed protein product [Debaryomyces fabryi]